MKKLLALFVPVFLAIVVHAGEVPDVTIAELKELIAGKKVVLIDVNGTKSWQEGHIPGAIDFKTSKDKLASVLPADKASLIVAYCGSPKCKAYKAAVEAAEKLGYTNVKHLSAGIKGWVKAGEPTQKGS